MRYLKPLLKHAPPGVGGVGGCVLVLLVLPQGSAAQVWNVPSEVTTIQAAIDSAAWGDTIRVGPGTYHERLSIFNKKLALLSVDGPETTILSGAGMDTVDAPILEIWDSPESVIEGFTFEDGVRNSPYATFGGAVYMIGGWDSTLRQNRFVGNRASYGGAVYAHYVGTLTIQDNYFADNNNSAFECNNVEYPVLLANTFISNMCSSFGGGAIRAVYADSCLVQDNVFMDNAGEKRSAITSDRRLIARGNTFVLNGVGGAPPVSYSGTVYLSSSQGRGEFDNNLFAMNPEVWAVAATGGASATFDCNLFWMNDQGDYNLGPVGPTNLHADPLLCEPYAGDLHVAAASPCLPENNLTCGLIGALGVGCSTPLAAPEAAVAPAPLLVRALRAPGGAVVVLASSSVDAGTATVRIHDVKGRLLHAGSFPVYGGEGAYRWDGVGPDGRRAARGVYFVRCGMGEAVAATRVVLVD